jgi:beta-lactamase class A
MISRRRFTAAAAAIAAGAALPLRARAAAGLGGLPDALAAIEGEVGGRLGVAVLDTATGERAGHRADERFPMCSTFKLLAAAAVLEQIDLGKDRLDRMIPFTADSLVGYSPVTEARVDGPAGVGSMSLRELCAAAVTVSDNTAANLLLVSIGGPEGLTAYARGLGDTVTRLDRIEPDMSESAPGDPRDTTSPAAMLANVQRLVLADGLSPESRERLQNWLLDTKTGPDRLTAGLPDGWLIGHKTGTGGHGTTNDVGILWPPDDRAPLVVAAYLTESPADSPQREAALAAVGEAVSATVS